MDKKSKNKTQVLAHSRRQRENDTFMDIAQALPVHENAKDLDKASILRLAIHYLKLRDLIRDGNDEEEEREELEEGREETEDQGDIIKGGMTSPKSPLSTSSTLSIPTDPTIADFLPNFSKDVIQALDGFLIVISRDGRVLFSSESITNYLGLRQVDVIGVNIQDLIHPQDYCEVARIFQTQGNDSEQVFDQKDPFRRKFVLRMRCAFTPSVRSITRCSNFKPIYCSCFLKFGKTGSSKGSFLGMVAFCKLATISKMKELVVGTFFKSKHSLDLSYTSVDTRIRWILGYDPSEMTGLKAYQYFHPQDLGITSSCHMNLLSRGISHSPCYRFMTRWGDWVWLKSKSQLLYSKTSHLPEGIVIYTWVVRVDEEDERMLAVRKGEDGEEHRKTYDTFSSSVSSEKGSLDVTALANPFEKPGKALKNHTPSLPAAPLSHIKSEVMPVIEPSLPYSPPLSAEASPVQLQPTPPPSSSSSSTADYPSPIGITSSPQMGLGVSSPPMGVGVSSPLMGVGMSSPPMGVAVSSSPMGVGVSSSPMGVGVSSSPMGMGVSSPPMGVGISSPPMGAGVFSPPIGVGVSSSPMGMGVSSPPMGASVFSPPMGVGVSSPPMGVGMSSPLMGGDGISMVTPPHSAMTECPSNLNHQVLSSDMSDQSFLLDQAQPAQTFMPSPPYTPYSNQNTPPTSTSGENNTTYTNFSSPGQQENISYSNFSSPYNPSGSEGQASPVKGAQTFANFYEGSNSPPHSTSSNVTPTYDHMTMMSSADSSPVSSLPFSHQAPPMAGHVTQFIGQQPMQKPSLEFHATFIPNANSTSTNFSEVLDFSMSGSNMLNMSAFDGVDFSSISSTQAPPTHVRQSVINNARARYSGALPTGHGGSHVSGHRGHGADAEVTQWSQWLKGSAPAPVC